MSEDQKQLDGSKAPKERKPQAENGLVALSDLVNRTVSAAEKLFTQSQNVMLTSQHPNSWKHPPKVRISTEVSLF